MALGDVPAVPRTHGAEGLTMGASGGQPPSSGQGGGWGRAMVVLTILGLVVALLIPVIARYRSR